MKIEVDERKIFLLLTKSDNLIIKMPFLIYLLLYLEKILITSGLLASNVI